MDYIYLIENVIGYIEDNLEENLSLDELAQRYYVSKYYFHRIFSAVMGCSLKEYINQRRLNKALAYMLDTSDSIADIAYRLQFGSQVSFARTFKNYYGFTPGQVRKEPAKLGQTPVPPVLKRAMKNFNSDVVTDFTFVEKEQFALIGFYMEVNLSDPNIQNIVNSAAKVFLESISPQKEYNAFAIYFKADDKAENSCVSAFFGIDLKVEEQDSSWPTYRLPAMLFAKFRYKGDLLYIGDTVVRDLKRWMNISKIQMVETEISFIQEYDQEYHENGSFSLFLPIRTIPQEM